MLVSFEFLVHMLLMSLARSLMAFSKESISNKFDMSKLLVELIMSLMNNSSFILSLTIVLLCILIISSDIGIVTVRGTWLEERHHSR